MKLLFFASFTLLFVTFSVGSASARVRIMPHLMLAEEYTDNLFLDAEEEEADWVTYVEPGIGLSYDSSFLEAEFDYYLRFRFYEENTEEDETNFSDIQRATADAIFFPLNDFTIAAEGEIRRVAVDERGPDVDESELVNTTNLYRYLVNPQYRWNVTRNVDLLPGYRLDTSEYESGDGDDTREHSYYLAMETSLSPTTDASLRYEFMKHEADFFQDFDQQYLELMLRQQFGARLTTELGISLVQIDFERSEEDEWVGWDVGLNYRFTDRVTLEASFLREFIASVTRGLIKRERSSLSLIYAGASLFEADVFVSNDDFLEDSTEDRVVGTSFMLRISLFDDFYSQWSGDYRFLDYQPDDEQADRYAVGVKFGYAKNRFDISLGYTYRVNESNVDVNDYRNNLVTLLGSLRY